MSAFDPRRALERGRATFADFTAGQKTVTALVVVALLAGGFLFSKWASRPSYTPLFSNLAATDASAITDKLNSSHEPYKLADGGTTILVPRKDVYQLRLDMSKDGLPTGGVSGYSLLDKQGITTSQFQQNVAYQRALEGELTKTIEALNGVQGAVVHLVIPQEDVFTDDERKASASVLVETAPGKSLGAEQVQAVVHLVSSSVEGLTPDNVTVADSAGHVLTAPGSDATAGSSMRDQQTAAYEDRVSKAVQDMLTPIVGAGHVVVRVNADVDYNSSTRQSETYVVPSAGPTPPAISESTSKETYSGSGTPSGGVLGPDNIAAPSPNAGGSDYSKETTTRNNAIGRVVEEVNTAPGAVKGMSVAVLLDENVAKAVDTAEVQKLVESAAGVQASRGDTVQVSTMPFDETAAKQAKEDLAAATKAHKQATLLNYAKDALMAIFLIVAALLLVRRARRTERTPVLTSAERLELEEARRRLALAPADADRLPATVGGAAPAPVLPDVIGSPLAGEVGDMVERQPEEVAQLLRGWLADRRS